MFQRSPPLVLVGTLAGLLGAVGLAPAWSQPSPVLIADVAELSGGGASNGANWRQGLELAVDEINAAGGLLGHPIQLTHNDTQTNPSVSRSMVQKAIDGHPLAIMGPIYSGSVKADMPLTQQAGIPQFVGAQAGALTEMGDPYLFRAIISQSLGMQRVADYIRDALKAKRVAIIWVNNDFGKGGHDILAAALHARGIAVTVDRAIEYGSLSFASDLSALRRSDAEAVFPYMTAEDTARFVMAYRKAGLAQPLIGETTLLQQDVLDLVGEAADGARAHLALTAAAPGAGMAAFRARFQARFNRVPDHNAIASYTAMYAIKTVVERTGRLDPQALADGMHGATITVAQQPNILFDSGWNAKGDLLRESFMGEVKGNTVKIVQTFQ